MLPEALSHEAWSLHQGELRRAVSFLVTVDDSGQIQATQIIPSVIKVSKRLSYQDVDAAIDLRERWYELYKLCKARLKYRVSRGALPLPIPELNISVDSHGQVFINLVTPGPARFLVAESMILANQVAAEFLIENNIPGLFRSQPPPRDSIINGNETALLPNIRQRRLISRGMLGTEPEPHSGLGLPAYTTVTSPLRRALDLLVQQQISSFLLRGKPLHTIEDIEAMLPILKQGLTTASQINQGTVRYWLIKYFAGRKSEVLKAWVIEAGQRRLTAVLQDTLTTFELPVLPGMEIRPDQEIEVKVKEAKPRENILRFYWANF
jgi:exoribonuclease-2